MDLIWSLMLVASGLVLLTFGGDRLVTAASGLSLRVGLSPMATGVVVVGLATSAPEIVLSAQAALGGQPDLAYANIVGSNIANVWLIAGTAGLIFPLAARSAGAVVSVLLMLAASLIWSAVTGLGRLTPVWGVFFLVALAGYLTVVCRTVRTREDHRSNENPPHALSLAAWLVFASLALPAGAQLLIGGATRIATMIGIGTDIVGLTLVAIGTSLPELAVTIASVARRRTDLILGNVIGSNMFNILAAGGVVALINAGPMPNSLAGHGNLVMLAAAFSITVPIAAAVMVGRSIGASFVGMYTAYMVFLAGIGV